jgi:hypothetical protein
MYGYYMYLVIYWSLLSLFMMIQKVSLFLLFCIVDCYIWDEYVIWWHHESSSSKP